MRIGVRIYGPEVTRLSATYLSFEVFDHAQPNIFSDIDVTDTSTSDYMTPTSVPHISTPGATDLRLPAHAPARRDGCGRHGRDADCGVRLLHAPPPSGRGQAGRQAPVAGERPCLGRGGAGRRLVPGMVGRVRRLLSVSAHQVNSKLQATPFSTLTNSKQIAVYNDDLFSRTYILLHGIL